MKFAHRDHIWAKIRRLKEGGRVRTLDLFGGCGGLSLGFQTAGFAIVGQVELDEWAAKSHANNFFSGCDDAVRAEHSKARDITQTEPADLANALHLGGPLEQAVDVVIGGPPCQAFARVGRAKLREVAEHPEAFKQDPRANLYLRFLHYVECFEPLAILMENVPDVINYGGHNIPEETCEVLSELGYVAAYTLLNSAFYGVPQMRERMFLIAYVNELNSPVNFPKPTHWIDLPRGYEGSRQVALKNLRMDLFDRDIFYLPTPQASQSLKPAVTAREALQDLPPITSHLQGLLRRGARRFTEPASYSKGPVSDYAKLMRRWRGYASKGFVKDHVIRYLPRDYALFRRMQPGDQYPEAHRLGNRMFEEELERQRRRGVQVAAGSAEYERLRKSIIPPYDPGKFPNKWRKMEADLPARTLMAHIGKDTYSHIHYDSSQARTISVREAARLQSFPDGFEFEGTMNPAFRQIGNAVPPLLAYALAKEMMKVFKKSRK